jgi:NAD(P)-dependent dehydrogenase (short-subunit alcohol dehydrogenase family)
MTILEKHLGRLKGQTAWITGGKRIGQVVARVLAEQGINIVASYRLSEKEAADTVAEAQRLGVRALSVQADVSLLASLRRAVEQVQAAFTHIHVLVNLASVYRPVAWNEVTSADWEEHFSAHVLGTFWPAQLIVPLMPPGSHIINVADITSVAKMQTANMPYVVTKAAVASMTRAMALEYSGRGIFVNALAPGPILAPEDFSPEKWARIRERSPVKYAVTDEEAVEQFSLLVLYLSMTTMSTGQVYPLDQGQHL